MQTRLNLPENPLAKDVLAAFKSLEKEDFHLASSLVGDVDLQKMVTAFSAVGSTLVRQLYFDRESSESDLWAFLWRSAEYSFPAIEQASGLGDKARATFNRAKALRLIYPDGTINAYARDLLRSIVYRAAPPQAKEPAKVRVERKRGSAGSGESALSDGGSGPEKYLVTVEKLPSLEASEQ